MSMPEARAVTTSESLSTQAARAAAKEIYAKFIEWKAFNPETDSRLVAVIAKHIASSGVQALERDLELRGISYYADLIEEGTPWESACEPEPQYFATFLEAYDHQIKLASSGVQEVVEALQGLVEYRISQLSPFCFGCDECRQTAKTRADIPHREFCKIGKAEAALSKATGKVDHP